MGYPNDQSNPAGAIPVYLAAAPSGSVQVHNIAVEGDVVLKVGPGTLNSVIVGVPETGATISFYDGLDNTGTLLTIISGASAPVSLTLGLHFTTGLYVQTAGAANYTILIN